MAPVFRNFLVAPRPVPDLCDSVRITHLFGPGELRRLFFTSRPSALQLNRRQRIRELLQLSRLMDTHSIGEFRDPTSLAHQELIDSLQSLARK
jgi:hypothetical protein